MKKSFFIIAAVVIATATAITVASCKKDKTEESNPSSENVVKNIFLDENEDTDNMDVYLLSFKEKLLNATKGGETISLEQAQRDLGNLLNFDFGDANYATDTLYFDTLHVKLTQSGGMVDLSQLGETYSDAFAQILASYRSLNLPDKSVYSIFCNYDDAWCNRDNESEDVSVVVTYRGFAGSNSYPISGHDTLNWHPRRIDHSCDNPSIFGGGARIMQNWLLNSQEQLACPNGGRVYFTDEKDWEKFGYTTYNATTGSFQIFGVFTYRIDTVCISHDEMEYYYTNILNYYNQETSIILPTRAIMRTYVDTAVIPYSQPNLNGYPGDLWYWRIFIHYGKPNCTDSEPIK